MKNNEGTVCGKANLTKHIFSNKILKPCGPGIMFETVFFFAQHLGVSTITTLGWDGYAKKSRGYQHFYKTNKEAVRDTYIAGHNELAINGSKRVYRWLKEYGCDLQIAGESHMHKEIPRITI